MQSDWREGFLYIGNQLSLDFLNTNPVIDGKSVEMLTGGGALARWMHGAGLVSAAVARRLDVQWTRQNSGKAISQLRDFRERFREAVFALEAGQEAPSAFVEEVNRLFGRHPYTDIVQATPDGLALGKRFEPIQPLDLYAPLLPSVAAVLTLKDPKRLRKCEGCVMHFQDTSKKGTRRWCSMNLCGNRSKVAAYAKRKREAI